MHKLDHLYIAGGDVNCSAIVENCLEVPCKVKHDPTILLLGIYLKELKIGV